MSVIKVGIYEDKNALRQSLEMLLNNTSGIKLLLSRPNCRNIESDFSREVPDVVLMDIDMPGMTGIEGTKFIRTRFPNVNVMMLTVFEDNENIFNALNAGATGYLIKSTAPDKIIEGIVEIHNGGSPISAGIARKILMILPLESKRSITNSSLTARENEILRLLSLGNSVKMVANQLNISYETVRTHVRRIYEKLHVNSATSAIHIARESGWI